MKAFLLHRDQDVDMEAPLPDDEEALTQDLGLNILFDAMSDGDAFLHDLARHVVLTPLQDPDAIVYRQHVLADCIQQDKAVREIYDLAVEAVLGEKQIYRAFMRSPDAVLSRSVRVMEFFVGILRRLRSLADEHAAAFGSTGFTRLFAMLETELDDAYFQAVQDQLRRLRFRGGVLVSAQLGQGCKGVGYTLRKPPKEPGWLDRIAAHRPSSYTVRIAERDEAGLSALAELRDRGVNLAANALAQSADHILSFFTMLSRELGFYVGCLNLHRKLADKGEPCCYPKPLAPGRDVLTCVGLYDPCLSLRIPERAVGNDIQARDTSLILVTGANQGGKSTFLRSVGLAQLMLQCGMFAPAGELAADVRTRVLTHYKREEDAGMTSGKLDEELARMSAIVDRLAPGCLVLFNESFAATNEREGSEIARQVLRALLESGVKAVFVTHLFDLAHGLYRQHADTSLFLRAERQDQGRRTFRLVEGEPLPTSYGQDLYERIFGEGAEAATATAERG